jgi:hypothetical protein
MKRFLQTLFFFLLVTQICFAQWVQVGLIDKSIKDIVVQNTNIFTVTGVSGSVYHSTDSGSNWTLIIDSGAVDIAIAPSGTIFLLKDHLFSSSDNGDRWDTLTVQEQIAYPGPSAIRNVSVSRTGIVYCGLNLKAFFIKDWFTAIGSSTDDGITWTTPGWGIVGGHLFDYKGESVISAGFFDLGPDYMYLSTDNGYSWTFLGYPNPPLHICGCHVLSLCFNGNILLGGCTPGWGCGIFLSTDTCNSWTQVSTLIPQSGLSIESGCTLVGTDSLGVFLFSDNGDSLGSRNVGLTNLNIHTLTADNNGYVYAGTDNGVWKRPLSEIVTSIKEISAAFPTEFLLSQNYPNPFNPTTTFRYSIPNESKVIIKVYDIIGREVVTLVNEEKSTGNYELTWNAANLPSGIYFYQLRAGDYIKTKKMILLK